MIPQTIVTFLGQSLGLLDAALQDPALLGRLLARMGYRVTLTDDDLPAVAGVLDIATELSTVIDNLDDLGNVSTAGDAAFEIVQASRDIVIALDGLANLSANDLAGLPAPLDTLDFWQDAATALLEQLLLETLETAYPRVATALALLGLINTQDIEIQGLTVSRTRFFWENLGPLLQDPPGYLAGIYGWGSEFNHGALLALLGVLLGHAELQPTFGPIREHLAATFFGGDVPAAARELALILFSGFLRLEDGTTARTRQGVLLMPVPERPGGAISGLYLANLSEGEAVTRIELGATLAAEIAGSADASGAVGIVLQPGRAPYFAGTAPALDHEIALHYTPTAPVLLIGGPAGPRLNLSGGRIALVFGGTPADPEIALELGTGDGSLELVIIPADGDSFISDLLAADALGINLDAGIRLSTRDGFSLLGGSGLEIALPLHITLGPVTISGSVIKLEIGESGAVELTLRVDVSAQIPPLTFVVGGVGLKVSLRHDDARDGEDVGGLRVALEFVPPDGIGLGIDAGVVSGGGYLEFDHDARTYAGVAELDAMAFGLTATGIIALQMPDGSDGWSLFLSVNASFVPIQLGFGFTLNGIGGLLGLHRAMDAEALGAGVRDGGLDSLMFPDDPIANAPRIIDDMSAFFPAAQGQFVIGFMLQIGWGTPTLITANVGFIIQLPEPLRLALLGQVAAVLPTEEVDIVRLNMDVLGVVDLSAGTLSIDASLRDSRVVAYTLSGDMALRASFIDDPTFLLSVGGFNPAFEAPEGFPELDGLSVALDAVDGVSIGLSGYFALTSNTVQFGAAAWVYADVLGYTVEGGVGFDVLLKFSPFSFRADVEFYISVKTEKRTLGSVMLAATLKGPKPWYINGTATLDVFGLDVNLPIEATIGSGESGDEARSVDVFREMASALQLPGAWRESAPAVPGDAVVMRADITDDDRVRPDGMLEVRQGIAPLDTQLDHFGNAVITGHDLFEIDSAALVVGDVTRYQATETVEEYFARAQYIEMSRAERLSSPSFEMMPCGVRFGGSGVSTGARVDSLFDYKEFVFDEELDLSGTQPRRPLGIGALANPVRWGPAAQHAAAQFTVVPSRASHTTFGVARPRYSVIDAFSGAVITLAEGARYDVAAAAARTPSARVVRLSEVDTVE
ncbi:MAG: hypothetical protein GX573_13045 [Chloroflexi bacterium]|nr:hypothetical protein [Chloroflexota bacterium]